MDTPAAPIPSTSPQLEVSAPAEFSSHRWLLWSAIGLTFLIFGTAIGVFSAKFLNQSTTQSQISSYEDCLAAKGSIVQYSYPATCVTDSGQRFVQPLTDEEKQNLQPPDLNREPAGSAATSDWKTYSNPKYGFTFKYPGMMNLKTSEAAEDRDFLVMANINPPETIDFSVALYAEHSPKSTLETQTLRFHDPNPIANPPIQAGEFSSITTTQVAGIIANTFTSNLCTQTEQKCTVYTLSHAGYIFKISTTESIKSSVTDQILSTFKFID